MSLTVNSGPRASVEIVNDKLEVVAVVFGRTRDAASSQAEKFITPQTVIKGVPVWAFTSLTILCSLVGLAGGLLIGGLP